MREYIKLEAQEIWGIETNIGHQVAEQLSIEYGSANIQYNLLFISLLIVRKFVNLSPRKLRKFWND
jgi:hypothetical protein